MENTASAMASMEKLDHSNQAFPVSEFIDEYDASSEVSIQATGIEKWNFRSFWLVVPDTL